MSYAWLPKNEYTSDQLMDFYYDVSGNLKGLRGSWSETAKADVAAVRDSLGEVPPTYDDSASALDAMNAMGLPYDLNPLSLPGLPRLAAQPIPNAPLQADKYKPVRKPVMAACANPPAPNDKKNPAPPPVGAGAPWVASGKANTTGQDLQRATTAPVPYQNAPRTAEGFYANR